MALNMDSKVIGHFAFKSKTEVVCDGDACIIAGSESAMRDYISSYSNNSSNSHVIKKTRFGDIIQGMKHGGAYAFDEESYNRFYPLANRVGYKLKEEDFSQQTETGMHFVVIRP
ncbi:hypothetical protein ACFL2V_20620 [Pseudomonadota bacterium]